MKRVVACLVLAVAVAGCGSSEPSWQDEWREQLRYEFENPLKAEIDPSDYLLACQLFGSDYQEELAEFRINLISDFDFFMNDFDQSTNAGNIRPIDETLADFGVERTASITNEVIDIYLDEFERACP